MSIIIQWSLHSISCSWSTLTHTRAQQYMRTCLRSLSPCLASSTRCCASLSAMRATLQRAAHSLACDSARTQSIFTFSYFCFKLSIFHRRTRDRWLAASRVALATVARNWMALLWRYPQHIIKSISVSKYQYENKPKKKKEKKKKNIHTKTLIQSLYTIIIHIFTYQKTPADIQPTLFHLFNLLN